jgi:Uma2 family endonuclease
MTIETIESDVQTGYEPTQLIEEIAEMASLEHGMIGALLSSYLVQYVHPRKLGGVFDAQTTFKVAGTPPTRQPDVAFVQANRLPDSLRKQADFAPDLAVEIVSENDKIFDTEAKILQYQQSGVPLIWIIYPFSRKVEIYRPEAGLIPQVIGSDGELDGADIIPGFKLAVSKLFE